MQQEDSRNGMPAAVASGGQTHLNGGRRSTRRQRQAASNIKQRHASRQQGNYSATDCRKLHRHQGRREVWGEGKGRGFESVRPQKAVHDRRRRKELGPQHIGLRLRWFFGLAARGV